MNAEHTQYLFEKYPDLYRGRFLPITQNLMPFGFETSDGWFSLIDRLSAEITELDKQDGTLTMAVQVKSKYGGLRFYVGASTDAVFDAITRAEDESLVTCEVCGEPGGQRGTSWIYTMCDKCWDTKQEEEKQNV